MTSHTRDEHYMDQALALAALARGRTSPNPMVGAVVVRDGRVVGEGFHQRAGEPHAEVLALAQAGDQARGADIYVTLEPCCHFGRTPPCTERIIKAGVKRVVAATGDPNPRVAGKGFERLRSAGIDVVVGIRENEARHLNEVFITYMTKNRPFVTAKWAMTLDGKIACASGDSRWVSGPEARRWVHELRDQVDGIMVGIGTILADDPLLTTRMPDMSNSRDPIRIILDSHLRIPPTAKVLHTNSVAPTWIVCLETADIATASSLAKLPNIEIITVPGSDDHVDLPTLLRILAQRKLTHVLLEGGATLNYAALDAEIIDKIYSVIAPKLVGGSRAPSPVGGVGISKMADAISVNIRQIKPHGEDLVIEGYPVYQSKERTDVYRVD